MTTTRPPLLSVLLLSASTLAYEVLLMRLFSIIQWHHFAYMIISLALLGYGISGTLVSVSQTWLLPRFRSMYVGSIVLFSLTGLLCFLFAQSMPFNAEQVMWDPQQPFYLFAIFIMLTLPFLFSASAICLAFMAFPSQIGRIYATDLAGAGMGSFGIVLLLYLVFPEQALVIIACAGLLAVMIAAWESGLKYRIKLATVMLLLMAVMWIVAPFLQLNISEYKSLNQLLQIKGVQVIAERSSPLGKLTIVKSNEMPLRHAPGLSLNAAVEPLPQLGVFTDADNMSVITRAAQQKSQLAYLDQVTWALPYHLARPGRVLILGAGGGSDVLQAMYHDAQNIDAVELNPQMIDLLQHDFSEFSGNLYNQEQVKIHISEARDFLVRNRQRYDVIQLALMDAFNASTSGLYALNESYLYTVEALQLYMKQLRPDGYLAITRWIKIPPRDTLKLFATAVAALRANGITNPEQQLVLIRSWQTSTLLIKQSAFTVQELKTLRQFCNERSFDIAYAPDVQDQEVNRYNVLHTAVFYQAAKSLLANSNNDFLKHYKFNLQPATDDRPYFHHFFKWSVLPEILQLRGKGGLPLLEGGYLILIVTLCIALLLSLLLILVPLLVIQRGPANEDRLSRLKIICYFSAIGLAFMFIEMAFIQRFIQFLHHPLYAIAVVLTAFLVFAGLGSYSSGHLLRAKGHAGAITLAVLGIISFSVIYLLLLPQVFVWLAAVHGWVKILVTLGLIAPLAFCMGMPFPLALASVSTHARSLLPWAWGINGCASVISAVLATILAIHSGFTMVVLIALALYITVIYLFPSVKSV